MAGSPYVVKNEFGAYCGKIYFNLNMKLFVEMPKIEKCLNCLKLRYFIDFSTLKISDIYNKEGAKRHYNFSHF